MKRALITGITGQDGSYLAELLLGKGYEVWGMVRRSSTFNTSRIDHLMDRLELGFPRFGDMHDEVSLGKLVRECSPDEVYNLAGQSHVMVSFDQPLYTADVDALGVLRLLEAVRLHAPEARVYQASTSEMFGSSPAPQSEATPFVPRSPYGVAKLFGHSIARCYREAYGMHVSCGIMFNHESPRRGETFVTRKITRAAARIKLGLQDRLYLGNLEARRDWGYAPEYVEAMWRMLQQSSPGDYVIGTGVSHSVGDFLQVVFTYLGLDWREHVDIVDRLFRPSEVSELRGLADKARIYLNWEPRVGFEELGEVMADADLVAAGKER